MGANHRSRGRAHPGVPSGHRDRKKKLTVTAIKILISSHLFAPSVGGIELVSGIVADEFNRLGHEVRVVTQTPDPERRSKSPFPVIRQPGRSELWRQIRWCDVYLQSNISLPTSWPAFLVRKPVLVVHHTWISRVDGRIAWQDRLKLFATRWVRRNLAVSKALAATIPAKCGVIANPYREDVFTAEPGAQRDRDLVFVGRLVSDKGCSILLEALARLAADAIRPALTVVGSGPELENLKAQAMSSGLVGQVVFAGLNTAAMEANKLYPAVQRYFIYETDNFLKNPDAIPKAMAFMDEHKDVAVIGFTCQKHAGHYTGSGDHFPTPWEFILSPPVVMRMRDKLGRGESTLREGNGWYWSDVVFSSPILVRREAWEQVGGFDPVNIPFAEADYDLAWRLRKKGWKEAILCLSDVIHDNRSVLSEWSQTRARRFHQARYRLMEMHYGSWIGWMKPFLFLRHLAEVTLLAIKAPFREKGGKRLAARWKLLTSVINGYN